MRMLVCLDPEAPIVFDQTQPIDQDRTLDIATFDLEPSRNACCQRGFYPLDRNPSPLVVCGDRLVFLGYPGRFRLATVGGAEFDRIMYVVSVADASGLRAVVDISKTVEYFRRRATETDRPSPHGGISGSPCFRMRPSRPAQLVGFTTSQSFGLLCFIHSRCLKPDGRGGFKKRETSLEIPK